MKEINEINLQDYIKEENNYIKQLNFSNQLANEIFKLNQISFFKRLILKLKMDIRILNLRHFCLTVLNLNNSINFYRVFSMVNLTSFNNKNSINESNYEHFMRSWGELESASENPTFLSTDKVGDIAYSFERENKIQVGLINIDFSYINPTALEKNKSTLKIANNRIVKRLPRIKLLTQDFSRRPPSKQRPLNRDLLVFQRLQLVQKRAQDLRQQFQERLAKHRLTHNTSEIVLTKKITD